MSTGPIGSIPDPPAAPPTELVYALPPEKPSSWPSVIGAIAVVFGVLGTLGGLWGVVGPYFMRAMMSAMPPMPANQTATLAVMQKWQTWTIAASLLGLPLAVVLLTGGIGLLRRRAWARPTCQGWAIFKILVVVATSTVGSLIQRDTFAAMSQADPNMPAMVTGVGESMAVVGLVIGVAWGWALPVFMLIWLARGKIKNEIAGWA